MAVKDLIHCNVLSSGIIVADLPSLCMLAVS